MRDYRIEVARWADEEQGVPYAYVFTHCVFAETTSLLAAETWNASWTTPTDLAAWEDSDAVGFAWGVNWANVDVALEVADSQAAQVWESRLGRHMREALIETQVYRVRLVYHELRVESAASRVD